MEHAAARKYVEERLDDLAPILTVMCPRHHVIAKVYATPWGPLVRPQPIRITAAARHEAEAIGNTLPMTSHRETSQLAFDAPDSGPRGGCRCAVYRAPNREILAAVAARKRSLVLPPGSEWHPSFGDTVKDASEISRGLHSQHVVAEDPTAEW
jgi:hypothetical protein